MSDDYTAERHDEIEPAGVTSDQNVEGELTKDQERIAQWQAAASEAPSAEDMTRYRSDVREAEDMLRTAIARYESSAATRALVYGWAKVAEEEDITPKRLHNWHREHVGHLEDLSTVPEKEMQREQRRIEAAQKRLEEEAKLRERVAAQQARLNAAREGLNR